MCCYLISGITSVNVKERIMMLEHFQKKHFVHSLGKTAEVIKYVLESSFVLHSTERCLAFTCFIGNILNDLSKLGPDCCIDSETSLKILTMCRRGDMNQLPTSCRQLIQKVLEELCKIRYGTRYSILCFMFMTYPFLPLENFHLKEIQRQDIKSNEENNRMLQSITRLICKKIVDYPPAKDERDFLDQFQRHLPLELQTTIVDYLVGSLIEKEYVELSVKRLLSMYKIHLKTACTKGRMNEVIAHFELLRRKHYTDEEVLISEFEPSFLHCLEVFDKKLTDNDIKTVFGVCVSGKVFRSLEMRERLLSVVVKSRNADVHYLFIQCLQSRVFDDLESERYVKLSCEWFGTAVECHCSCSPKDNTEFVKSVYKYLGDLLSVDTLSKLPDFNLSVCERAYIVLHTIDILDTIRSIPKIEELPDVEVEDIFKQHVQRHLKESFSAGLIDIPDLVKRICGKTLEKIRISSK
ncbi:hypothetical protein FSP39_002078 [Pinctada imbricata]|uniref:Uncharacterized protein n=1 Tax=Pinctada imbricata TaxID=66713 RepID=A0AA89BVR9_PINIB|nr:hypothetical protein FSP39_002078 [Pinctada imbricata]